MKKKSGQILVLVLLVVVVALAVGLAVASRNITNLRTATQTEQSQRAFSVAEGGVEDVLSQLSQIAAEATITTSGVTKNVPVGDLTATVIVKGSNIYEATIDEGTVGQIDLKGAGATVDSIRVDWGKQGDPLENPPASIEVNRVYGTAPSYSQARSAWAGVAAGRDGNESSNFKTQPLCSPSTGFLKCIILTPPRLVPPQPSLFLRIRPFWTKATVRVTLSGTNLPVQTYDVTSTATTPLGITRKVQVRRTALPALPATFDYALFSEQDLVK